MRIMCKEKSMHDILGNLPSRTIRCLDHGHVTIVDSMPRLVPHEMKTADFAIVQAARVSYGDGTKSVNEDRGLIRYLMRHKHTTPFEMIQFKFHCKMPIFVARQWVRHRMCSINEYSGRYSIMKDEFYAPDASNVRAQSKTNKQGGDSASDESTASDFLSSVAEVCDGAYGAYEKAVSAGVSREQARMLLPVNLYTEWYWKIDLHNLLHFLSLRCDSHAQQEIRVFAEAVLELIKPIVPWAIEAWEDYHDSRGAVRLTRLEVDALRKSLDGLKVCQIDSENTRERSEWASKLATLGLGVSDSL